jgi:hypothetical protein
MKKIAQQVRVQLDMSNEEAAGLDSLKEACGLRSRSDAVRTALAVIEWVSREADSGRRIVALGGDVVSEFVMPGVTIGRGNKRKEIDE